MSTDQDQDQARLIAERVARRVSGNPVGPSTPSAPSRNGAPVHDEISALREGLHDLESKLDRIESKIVSPSIQPGAPSRARVIDFVSSGPPLRSAASIASPPAVADNAEQASANTPSEFFQFVPATQSPWLGRLSSMLGNIPQSTSPNPAVPSHPSEERFGVEEATVKELVEFFENEKKCAIDPSGKPCDHCAMCSSRGF